MKFIDINREYEDFDWQESLKPVFDDKCFINGSSVKQFEKNISSYLNCKYSVGVSSGTDALTVALMSTEIKNPVVLTTPYTFISTVETVLKIGGKVLFCDITDDFNININRVKEIIENKNIDIFLPVHLFGNACYLDEELLNLCKNKNVRIIEDAAQALGTEMNGKKVGTIGNLGCFSFFPSKNLGGAGDGGLVVTNDENLCNRCLMIRNHGSKIKYIHEIEGGNFRLDTIQAAILNFKLSYLNKFLDSRIKSSRLYNDAFSTIKEIKTPRKLPNILHTYNQYVLQIKENRDVLKKYLNNKGIPTALYYPSCLTEQPYLKGKFSGDTCTISKNMARKNIALPIAHLTEEERNFVIKEIKNFYEN